MDTNTIDSQLAYLEETKLLLKDAIINKGQNIQNTDTFRSYANKIDQISTLAEETADVQIMLEQMRIMFDADVIDDYIEAKKKRLEERLKNERY